MIDYEAYFLISLIFRIEKFAICKKILYVSCIFLFS